MTQEMNKCEYIVEQNFLYYFMIRTNKSLNIANVCCFFFLSMF